jgi:hypothetical protein
MKLMTTAVKNETELIKENENKSYDNTTFYFLTLFLVMVVTFSLFTSEILHFIFLEIF